MRSYNHMVPLESLPVFGVLGGGGCSSGGGGGFAEAMMMRETTTINNNQDHSSGDTCSISDPTGSTNYYNFSTKKEDGSAAKNDVVCCNNNVINKDKSWLRLGIGPEENNNNNHTTSFKVKRYCSESGRDRSLELSLFSTGAVSSTSVDHPPPHDQLVYNNNHQLVWPHRGFSKPWIPQYTAPFYRQTSLGMMSDVTNNISVTRSSCVDDGGAGPSSEFRVLDPPRRPHSGLWFLLQASQLQEKEPFLPQVNKSYLRIKDGRITVRLLIKYLMKKLQLDSESEIEIRCRGEQLSPLLTMQHVRDTIWSPKSSSPFFTLLRDSSTSDHVMILNYGRIA